jgi:hypothetical protein
MKILFILIFLLQQLCSHEQYKITPDTMVDGKYQGIRILDTIEVKFSKIDGENFYGISSLAYDENRDILYMLNDRGRLFTTRLVVKDERMTFLKPVSAYRLKNSHGRKILKPRSDSEGMTLLSFGDKKEILISFERQPRIERFDTTGNGYGKKGIKLPKRLRERKNYQGKNGMLEALTYHPKYGILTTAEFPLKDQIYPYQGIFNSDGEVCKFKKDYFDNAVTEFETLKDGNLLILQRDFDKKNFKIAITLKKLYLDTIKDGICKVKNLAVMKTDDGWNLDNFEGLTHYKDNMYLMISDDNGFFLQNTILTMFEIVDMK